MSIINIKGNVTEEERNNLKNLKLDNGFNGKNIKNIIGNILINKENYCIYENGQDSFIYFYCKDGEILIIDPLFRFNNFKNEKEWENILNNNNSEYFYASGKIGKFIKNKIKDLYNEDESKMSNDIFHFIIRYLEQLENNYDIIIEHYCLTL